MTNPNQFTWSLMVLTLVAVGCRKDAGKPDALITAKLDAIRQAGYPVTLIEYNEWYVTPPASENAATVYQQAFEAIVPSDTRSPSPSFVAKNQKTLELLHQAASFKKCRYPIDLSNNASALLPHLEKLRSCALLLVQDAVSQSTKGRNDLAVQSLLDGLHLSRSLEEEPTLVAFAFRTVVGTLNHASLQEVVNRKALSEEQLAQLQSALRTTENGTSPTRALAGERCMGIAVFQMPDDAPQAFARAGKTKNAPDLANYRKNPAFQADYSFFLDRLEQAISATTQPYPKSLDALSDWSGQLSEAQTKGYQISGFLLPNLDRAIERAADVVARLRVCGAALAVERYRIAHANALPDALAQLTPQFLEAVPTDPFDGQPLRYKKLSPRGFVVYSIGTDRQDDGGQSKPKPSGSIIPTPADLTFAIRR